MISSGTLLLFFVGVIVGAFCGWFSGMKYVLANLDDAFQLRDEMKENQP